MAVEPLQILQTNVSFKMVRGFSRWHLWKIKWEFCCSPLYFWIVFVRQQERLTSAGKFPEGAEGRWIISDSKGKFPPVGLASFYSNCSWIISDDFVLLLVRICSEEEWIKFTLGPSYFFLHSAPRLQASLISPFGCAVGWPRCHSVTAPDTESGVSPFCPVTNTNLRCFFLCVWPIQSRSALWAGNKTNEWFSIFLIVRIWKCGRDWLFFYCHT